MTHPARPLSAACNSRLHLGTSAAASATACWSVFWRWGTSRVSPAPGQQSAKHAARRASWRQCKSCSQLQGNLTLPAPVSQTDQKKGTGSICRGRPGRQWASQLRRKGPYPRAGFALFRGFSRTVTSCLTNLTAPPSRPWSPQRCCDALRKPRVLDLLGVPSPVGRRACSAGS